MQEGARNDGSNKRNYQRLTQLLNNVPGIEHLLLAVHSDHRFRDPAALSYERFFAYFQQHPHLQASVSFQPANLWGNMQHQSLRAAIPASFHQLETHLAFEVFHQLETLLAFEAFPSSSHRLLGEAFP
uniref:Uncharacterized protein n=1 Tax=Solanum lycopersicum TaxID=4081 RepID=A0A3Q7FS09_SOLLC